MRTNTSLSFFAAICRLLSCRHFWLLLAVVVFINVLSPMATGQTDLFGPLQVIVDSSDGCVDPRSVFAADMGTSGR